MLFVLINNKFGKLKIKKFKNVKYYKNIKYYRPFYIIRKTF